MATINKYDALVQLVKHEANGNNNTAKKIEKIVVRGIRKEITTGCYSKEYQISRKDKKIFNKICTKQYHITDIM